jgi:4-diphosphocytidyl-2-C-methyl-D-erythritol kinase
VLTALAGQPGCELVSMSGSGATCFGIFPDLDAARTAEVALRGAHPDWWMVASRTGAS